MKRRPRTLAEDLLDITKMCKMEKESEKKELPRWVAIVFVCLVILLTLCLMRLIFGRMFLFYLFDSFFEF